MNNNTPFRPKSRPNDRGPQKQNNYFTQNMQRNGGQFVLSGIDLQHLSGDCERIFRELASGRIDVNVYGHLLLMPELLNALIHMAAAKKDEYDFIHYCTINTVNMTTANGQNLYPVQRQIVEKYTQLKTAYNIIYAGMLDLCNSKNPAILIGLIGNIRQYRGLL